jgi:DtxR family Mn-dependent transcriptional regulator
VTTEDPHPSTGYLRALYELQEEHIAPVQASLARWMGVSRASVSEHVKRLVDAGWVQTRDRELRFTRSGRSIAISAVRRHRLTERLLADVIGLPWHVVHARAERWGRVVDADVEERLVRILGDPGSCPHGNPIPGSANEVDVSSLTSLLDIGAGTRVVLRRLTEDLEVDVDVMRFLEDGGLMPGARVTVRTVAPDGTVNLDADGTTSALGRHLADNLWVDRAR